MPDNIMEQIAGEIRSRSAEWYPGRGEARAVRVVGHTPKTDHYIYDLVVDFANSTERLAAKLYRTGKNGQAAACDMAAAENAAYAARSGESQRRKISPEYRSRWATSVRWARW